jgi:hypothetical protein
VFPVAAIAGVGWLFLFVVLLIAPARTGRMQRPEPGEVPPAVVSLLARRLDRSGFGATLVDLAARGWFEVRGPAGPGGPALCVVRAETPGGPLTPFERRVIAHVALRAGARGEVPAPALSDGFGGGGGRTVAYAAALGAAPAALAVFAQGSTNVAWSSYRGSWQLLEIETNTWSWPWGCAVSLAIGVGPVLYFAAAIWLGTHGMVLLAEEMVGLVVAAGIAGGLVALARRAALPRVAEFDGQVIRQWMVKGDSDSEDEYHVAIDDGTREKAWDLSIGTERYRRLPPAGPGGPGDGSGGGRHPRR